MATVALETPNRCRWLLGVPRPGCAHQPIACPQTHPLPTPPSPAHPQVHLLPTHPSPAHTHPLPSAPSSAHCPILCPPAHPTPYAHPPHHPVSPARCCSHRSTPVHLLISHPPSSPAPLPHPLPATLAHSHQEDMSLAVPVRSVPRCQGANSTPCPSGPRLPLGPADAGADTARDTLLTKSRTLLAPLPPSFAH